jgi:hypothetical protein
MAAYIPNELRQQVIERASGLCEYCIIHQDDTPFSHQIDHVIALKDSSSPIVATIPFKKHCFMASLFWPILCLAISSTLQLEFETPVWAYLLKLLPDQLQPLKFLTR